MVPKLSENLEEYIEAKTLHNLTSFRDKGVELGFDRTNSKNEEEYLTNSTNIQVINATTMSILSVDRLGITKVYKPNDPENTPTHYIRSNYQYIGFKILISCDGQFGESSILRNKLAEIGAAGHIISEGIEVAKREVSIDTYLQRKKFLSFTIRISKEFFLSYGAPIYIKELDIVIGVNQSTGHYWHPHQPGNKILTTDKIPKCHGKSFYKSYLYVDNNKDRYRDLWIVDGIEIINLKPVRDPECDNGIYITKNQSDHDGVLSKQRTYMTYEEFIEANYVCNEQSQAKERLDMIHRAMLADSYSVESKITSGKKIELERAKMEQGFREKEDNKLLDSVVSTLKYLAILLPIVIALK